MSGHPEAKAKSLAVSQPSEDKPATAGPVEKKRSPRRRAGLRNTTPALPDPCSEPFKILASLISVSERFKTDLGNLRPNHPQVAEVIHFLDIAQLSAEQLLPLFGPPPPDRS